MGKFMKQLWFLLYKNYLFKKRNRKGTMLEIGVVLYFVAILAVIKTTSDQDTKPPIRQSDTMKLDLNNPMAFPSNGFGYVINNPSQKSILEDIVSSMKAATNMAAYRFDTEQVLDEFYQNNPLNFTVGLLFNFDNKTQQFSYTVKVNRNEMASVEDKETGEGNCRAANILTDYQCPGVKYVTSKFSAVQALVDLKYIEVSTTQKNPLPLSTSLKMFPKAEFTPPNEQLRNLVGIYMVIAFAPYISFLLTNIVKEKETKIKESMKIMGLNMLAYWISWFITYAVIILIGSALTTLILTLVKVFGDTHFLIIFFVFLLYGFSIITLSFMLTPLFTNAKNAGSFASLGTMILSLIGLLHNYVNTGIVAKWFTALLSPVALSLSLQPALDYSSSLTWDNISSKGEFPTSNGLIMLLIDTILYLLVAIYLDFIFPGEYGKAKHPLFIFSPSFWKNTFGKQDTRVHRQNSLLHSPRSRNDEDAETINEDIEVIDEDLVGGKVISINDLKKVFKQGKKKPDIKALKGVSFDVYEGQITALLGHNGAGKSTLISILTGMLTPSSGSAEMYGFNIRDPEELDNIRQIVGLCPQQNIIFDQLNPREHLIIYAGIKGIPMNAAEGMVDTLLREIDLDTQVNTIAKDLSGGQKRKLCIGIALIGNPKIVFLDEPTSGMDPSSRRHIWNLLQSKRQDRVIFLTTHFMDEADILADSKAILSNGKIRCSGSSLFLKNRFGIGYHLGMVLDEGANVEAITNIVTQHVSGGELSRQHGKELAYRLPLSEVSKFTDLFKAFEESNCSEQYFTAPHLGIVSYGVSMTTLEEVFLKLGDEVEDERVNDNQSEPKENDEKGHVNTAVNVTLQNDSHLTITDRSLSGSTTHLHNASPDLHPIELNVQPGNGKNVSMLIQLMALLEIRFRTTIRNPMKIIFQGVIPPIMLIVGLVLMRNTNSKIGQSKSSILNITPSMYLQQGHAYGSNAKEILWKLNSAYLANRTAIENGFAAGELKDEFVTNLGLMKLAPHVVAYNIDRVEKNGILNYTLYWNASQVHSIPVGINALSNAMYHIVNAIASPSPPRNASALPIVTYNKPFKPRQPKWAYDYSAQIAVLLIGLSVATMAGGFSVEVVFTREIGVRHQLRVSGVSRLAYWLMFCIGDVLVYIPLIIVLLILIPAMDIKAFNNGVALGAIFLLIFLYIFSSLFFSYALSFVFQKGETAQNAMPTIINMLSIIPFFAVTITDMVSGSISGKPFHATLAHILCVLDPPFTLMAGMYYISRVYRVETLLGGDPNIDIPASKYFGWEDKNNALPGIYIITLFHIVLLVFATYAIDCYKAGGFVIFPFSLFSKLKRSLCGSEKHVTRQSTRRSAEQENADVRREREEVAQCIMGDQVSNTGVVVQGLKKSFGQKKVVRDITFKVEKGEILGLLGPNGAGKTTSLNMITADLRPDMGEVYIGGHNIEKELEKAFQNLGYCPQFDSVWKNVTMKEHLKCYGLIKGIPAKHLPELIDHYADALKIGEHMHKYSQHLSGGTKRKLSFLISMIGNSGIVVLDEPSTGMDPGARRFLWSVISSNIKDTRGAILTTHSMEEADALCARVGIVVKGRLKCIGTTQELKSNYGGGYQLEVKFKIEGGESAVNGKQKVDRFVRDMFTGAYEMEYYGTRIMYKIPNTDVKNLSAVFAQLEAGKDDVSIEEYSFSQSSLEQVFLEFAKEQDDDATGKVENDEDDVSENVDV